ERIHRITRTTMLSQDACRVVAIRAGFSAEHMNKRRMVLPGIDWDICPSGGKPTWSYCSHGKPDLIACCADSDACCQLVNQYCIDKKIPCVFGGVHGAAETAEVITFVPGKTPCYACYEREGPDPEPSQEKYTNPNYDPTKMPHQEG